MTAHNSEIFISLAIKSVLAQTFRHFELIIIDDGSTDDTAAIIASFHDERITLITHEKQLGVVKSRNHALDLASGEYFAFFDSDDIAYPQKFEKQIKFLDSNPEIGFVGSSVVLIDENDKQTGRWFLNAKPAAIPSLMLFQNYFVNSAVVFRADLLDGLRLPHGYDICEDYYLWWKLLQASSGYNLPELLTNYRQHSNSLMHKHIDKKKECDRKLYSIILGSINIEASDEEIVIHRKLKENHSINSIDEIRKIKEWLLKISSKAGADKRFQASATRRIIMKKWLKVCYNARYKPILFLCAFLDANFYFKLLLNEN